MGSLLETFNRYLDESLQRHTLGDGHQHFFVESFGLCPGYGAFTSELGSCSSETPASDNPRLGQRGEHDYNTGSFAGSAETSADCPPAYRFSAGGRSRGPRCLEYALRADTIHRSINHFRLLSFSELKDTSLSQLQTTVTDERIVFPEVRMVGGRSIGRTDSRLHQAKVGFNPSGVSLRGVSHACSGDPAHGQAMFAQQLYALNVHDETIAAGKSHNV